MGILGIKNRTENWKTAQWFAPFFTSDSARTALANRLACESEPGKIKIELFWKGMRDYIAAADDKNKPGHEGIAKSYKSHGEFRDLRERIERFCVKNPNAFNSLESHNYDASKEMALFNNLKNTEIDIVLQTQKHLFIGEAKDESRFGADGRLVLVHQLIRQYVMAKILLDCLGCDKKVVPFIVGDKLPSLKKTAQVKFMREQGWLEEKNILSWDDIEELCKAA